MDPEQSGVIPPSMYDCVEKEKKLRRLEAQELQRSKGSAGSRTPGCIRLLFSPKIQIQQLSTVGSTILSVVSIWHIFRKFNTGQKGLRCDAMPQNSGDFLKGDSVFAI